MEQETAGQDLRISQDISQNLSSTRKWTQFISIFILAGLGLMVIFGFSFSFFMRKFWGEDIPFDSSFSFIGFFYLLIALIYFFPFLFLLQFSRNIKIAIRDRSQDNLDLAFSKLNSHYSYLGIIMVIVLAIYGILGLFSLIGLIFSW